MIANYGQAWYDEQAALNRERAKRRYHEHPELRPTKEKSREYGRRYRLLHLEQERQRNREYFRKKFGCNGRPMPDANGMVPCRKCGTLRKFRGPKCFSCRRAAEQSYRDTHRALFRQRLKEWKANNPKQYLLTSRIHCSKRRAKNQACEGTYTKKEWLAILKRHKNKCAHCGTKGTLAVDHIIPLSRGGTNFAYNLQPLCRTCNSIKHAKLPKEAQFSLFDRTIHR